MALLPQLEGKEKLKAIEMLISLSNHSPEMKHYTYMYLEEAERQKDAEEAMWAWNYLVTIYYEQFDTDSLFIIGEKSMQFAREHEFYDSMFYVRWQFIRRRQGEGKLLTAFREAQEAYAEAKALNLTNPMSYMLASISDFYYNMGQYEEAIRYRTEASEMAAQDKDSLSLFFLNNYNFLALMEFRINRPHEMLRYADSIKSEINRLHTINPDYSFQIESFYENGHRALAYAAMKQPAEALRYIRLAESFYSEQIEENIYYGIQLDEFYAPYLVAIGKYDNAIERYNRILKYYEEINLESEIPFVKKSLAQTLFQKGDYKSAAEAYSDAMNYKDSINHAKFYSQINEFRTIYELDKSELQSERRLAAIKQQRTVITGLATTCTAMLIIIVLVVWNRNRIARKNRALYRQIKEQDRLAQENERFKEIIDESEHTETQTGNEETSDSVTKIQYRKFVAKLNRYLLADKAFAKPDTDIDKLIAKLEVSRSFLFAAVKSVTGKTVLEYTDALRLNEAKQLLAETNDLIEVIAQKCGYVTVRTFYRQFREQYNITPAQYRKMAKNND
jgi:AraC-like DNA-binding protein